jgi:peptidyl-prolyl cis-trans isomerase C
MNSITKKHLWAVGLALAFCQPQSTIQATAADKVADIFPDPVVASGTGFELKRSQLDEAFISYNTSLAASGGSVPEDQRATVRSNLLDHLIINKILVQKATADDKVQTKKLVEDGIEEARKSAPTPEAFDAQIKASGMTLDTIRTRAYEEQLCRRIWQREITNGIVITDAAAQKFYADNPDKFEQPEQVRAAHVLISTLDPISQRPLPPEQKKDKEKLAKEIKARADKGEDFGALAKQYSDDPGSKNKGGEYKFPRNQMVPEFEAAAFSLKTNQISDLVETRFGYHIIKLLEKYPAKHEQFAEVKDRIKEYLMEKQAKTELPAYMEKLKVDYKVALATPPATAPAPAAK